MTIAAVRARAAANNVNNSNAAAVTAAAKSGGDWRAATVAPTSNNGGKTLYSNNPLTSAGGNKDIYGDVGTNSATGTGAKFDANKKVGYESTFGTFGKEAEMLQAKDPQFLTRRNDYIATDIIGKGDTSEQTIRNYLTQNPSFASADPTKQQHTIQAISGRIMKMQNKDTANQVKGDRDKFLEEQAKAVGSDYDSAKKLLGDAAYSSYGQAFYKMNPADQELYKSNIQEQLAGLKNIQGNEANKNAQIGAIGTNFSEGYEQVRQDSTRIQDYLNSGKTTDEIAGLLGKPIDYVNSVVNGDVSKFTQLSSEEQANVLKYNIASKEQQELETNKAKQDAQLALSRAQEDYQKSYADQTQTNSNMESSMSVLARMTGVGYSSTGLEGITQVHQKGLDALVELTKNMDRYSADIQTQMTNIADNFNYNTKVLDMQADDAVKQSKNGFFNTAQQIKTKYGELSEQTMEQMRMAATDFTKQVYAANQWRVEQQNQQADRLYQRMKDAQQLEIDKFKANIPSAYDQTTTQKNNQRIVTYQPKDQTDWTSQVQDLIVAPQIYAKQSAKCGQGINNLLGAKVFIDPISDKTSMINSTTAGVGKVAIFDWNKAANATREQKKYGHVAIVTKVDAKGNPIEVADRNRNNDQKYNVHSIKPGQAACIAGYFDPTQSISQTATSGVANSKGSYKQLSPEQQLQVDSIAVGMYGKRSALKIEQKDTIAYQMLQGKDAAQISAETMDYLATQKLVSTMNTTTQVRLKQAISFTDESLGLLDNMSAEAEQAMSKSGITSFASVQRKAALSGVLGNDVKKAFTKLDSQVTDLISELSIVYKGGESPTDESLKQASNMLNGNRDYETMKSNIALIRKNLELRKSSLDAVGIATTNKSSFSDETPATPATTDTTSIGGGRWKSGGRWKGK